MKVFIDYEHGRYGYYGPEAVGDSQAPHYISFLEHLYIKFVFKLSRHVQNILRKSDDKWWAEEGNQKIYSIFED